MMTDIFIMALSTIGALFILIASYGIYRMPDFYARLSVTIKAATMGIGCILAAAALHFSEFSVTTKALAIVFFLFLTSPVAGFLIGRVAYFTGTKLWKHSIIDEMRNDPESSCATHEKKKEEPVKKIQTEKEE